MELIIFAFVIFGLLLGAMTLITLAIAAVPVAIWAYQYSLLFIAYILLIGAGLWLAEIHFALGFAAWVSLLVLAYVRYKQQHHNAS